MYDNQADVGQIGLACHTYWQTRVGVGLVGVIVGRSHQDAAPTGLGEDQVCAVQNQAGLRHPLVPVEGGAENRTNRAIATTS